jgi:hypothetical protein
MPAIVATQAMLTEARKAYHSLMTGVAARVVVDQNGERVEFVAANAPKLYAYIQQLEMTLGTACGDSPVVQGQYHPAGFIF